MAVGRLSGRRGFLRFFMLKNNPDHVATARRFRLF